MSATTESLPESQAVAPPSTSLRRATVTSGLAAAALTTAAAAAVHAVGVSFEIEGEMIPLLGFAQMTFVGAVIGGFVLAGLNRWNTSARRRFLQVTALLTVVSCVPSVGLPDDAASQTALVALHLLAAAIVIPALARHARN